MERVSAWEGDSPIMVVAPHGADDDNTDYITERIAQELQCYAVINRGWERAMDVDYWNDKANCNDVRHIHEDVVKEEFLDPILRFSNRILKDYGFCHIFIIHGVGNYVRQTANDPKLDLIIGYGAGGATTHSCDLHYKDAFIYACGQHGFGAYEGAAGGAFAGRAKNNLNQLFRRWYPNERVQSLQIEIVREFREDKEIGEIAALELASCMDDLITFDDTQRFLVNTKSI